MIISNPNMKATPVNCTNNNGYFQEARYPVKRWKTCVTGMEEKSFPGSKPISKNKKMVTNAGTHRVRYVNRVANEAPDKSSISGLK